MSVANMTAEEKLELGSMQLQRLELSSEPTEAYHAVIKSYVDSEVNKVSTSALKAVNDLIDSAPENLNTLREIAISLNNNSDLAGVLTSSIGNVQTAVTSEAVSRAEAVQELKDSASAESSLRNQMRLDDQQIVEMKIAAETSMRMESEQLLRSDLEYADQEEKDARTYAVNSLNNKITQEAENRASAISSEASTRASVDASLVNLVEEEKSLRVLAISVEESKRTMLAEELNGKVAQETADRQLDVATLSSGKLDQSMCYSGGSESPFKIAEDSFLVLGDFWRLRALNSGVQKRLVFEHRVALDAPYKTAIPFIRQA